MQRWVGRQAAGVALAAVSATSFGVMALLARIAYDGGADVHGLLLVRFAIASAVLVPLALLAGGGRLRWQDAAVLVAMGGIGYVGQSMSYFSAAALAPVGLVGVIFGAYPVLVALLAAGVHRRRPEPAVLGLAVMAVVGTALVAGPALGGSPAGALLAVLAGVIYSVYIVVGEGPSSRVSPLRSTALVSAAAFAVYAGGLLVHGPSFPSTGSGWLAVVAIGLVCTVLAILAFFGALRLLGPAAAATASTVEPVVTVASGAIFLGERLSGVQLVGAVVVLAAVVLVATGRFSRGMADVVR